MACFNLFVSNRMEVLAERLADAIRCPLSSPLQSEIVIVPNRGMERWLSQQIARRLGVCANIRFPFPRAFLYETLKRLTGAASGDEYDPEIMTWRIMKILPVALFRPSFESLRRYLADDPACLKRFQLAACIARVFDAYLIFRPEMVAAWERGENGTGDEGWQAELWRMMRTGFHADHIITHREIILQRLRAASPSPAILPQRVSIFGISTLPVFYLDLFHALSRAMEVNCFFMNPCREFWGDIRSEKEAGRMVQMVRERTGRYGFSGEDLYLEEGNSLLASLGKQGRDYFAHLAGLDVQMQETFVDPGEETLLAALQSDALNLRDRGRNGIPRAVVSSGDRTLMIHSCHGPLREVEVLHDQLLEMFDEDAALLPKDILVMAPDIEAYAPFIEAVFGSATRADSTYGRRSEIPYSIADRSISRGSSVILTFLAILDLHASRFRATRILSILDAAPVQKSFGLDGTDVEKIRRWISKAGIRWGIDGQDRARSGLPAFQENTWRAGLDRLLLGFALPGRGEKLFRGVAPYDDLEGMDARILGRFLDFAETLFSQATGLDEPRTLDRWAAFFQGLLDRLFAPAEADEEADLRLIRRCLEKLGECGEKTDHRGAVEFAVIKSYLTDALEKTGVPFGYLTGAVTFCAMVPMRSIPFPVVCLLGMNNAAYPRQESKVGFDLMAAKPRPGDRSRREDDRYLFLEALLSARKRLYISYVGQSSEDNSAVPPSVLVSELLDYLEQGFATEEGDLRDRLLTVHRLQAFHPAYFSGDPKLFSYSEENCRAARRLMAPSGATPVFASGVLPDPEPRWREIAISDLAVFFRNPAKFLLQRRIGLSFAEGAEITSDTEPFRIEGLDRYRLGQELVEQALAGRDPLDLLPVMMAAGQLP
ncbi:MAG: exodeoxyribonuclease V subunit gamma, partial [Proteobacteria bacterium]|nr:exodeoxyribonuclease V subunit gamma [Pseudomonadota bacterium]